MAKKQKTEADYEQNALFREVAEDVERERMLRLWKTYGARFIAVAVVIILMAVGIQGYFWYREAAIEKDAAAYAAALDQAIYEPVLASEAFQKLIREDGSGYALLSRFQMASQKFDIGQNAAALNDLREIGGDKSVAEPFRRLANVILCYYLLDAGNSAEEIAQLMTPLAADDSMWRGSAREILAMSSHKAGKRAEAVELLEKNKDDASLPEEFGRRASEMLSVLN